MASTVWRGYITFGLISIPVRLFRAARAERVNLRRLYRREAPASTPSKGPEEEEEEEEAAQTGTAAAARPVLEPVRQVSVREGGGEALPQRAVVKGFEFEKGQFVALDSEELKNLAPKTATEMQIAEFVNLAEVDPVYFETSYYVAPEQAGQKAYALLYRALQKTTLVAVAQFAMHSREHVVLLRPARTGLIAHTMFFATEVRAEEEFRADTESVTTKELSLAETLIHSLAAPFEPQKYHDTYREKLEALIAQKVAGTPVAPEPAPLRSASVVDITEALQRSLAALKKPAASDTKAARHPSGRAKVKRAGT
jgi:DNA end-binding protein Ku